MLGRQRGFSLSLHMGLVTAMGIALHVQGRAGGTHKLHFSF